MTVTDESSVGSTTESSALPTWSAGMDSRSADRAKSIAEVAVFTYVLSLIWGISLKFRDYLAREWGFGTIMRRIRK